MVHMDMRVRWYVRGECGDCSVWAMSMGEAME